METKTIIHTLLQKEKFSLISVIYLFVLLVRKEKQIRYRPRTMPYLARSSRCLMKILHIEFQSLICGPRMTFQYILACGQYIDWSLPALTIIKDYHIEEVFV